jgi:hypothetical protein
MFDLSSFGNIFVSFFSQVMGYILTAIASLLPSSNGFNIDFLAGFAQIMGMGYQLGFMIPWSTVFTCLIIVVGFEMTIFTFKIAIKVVGLIRGGS